MLAQADTHFKISTHTFLTGRFRESVAQRLNTSISQHAGTQLMRGPMDGECNDGTGTWLAASGLNRRWHRRRGAALVANTFGRSPRERCCKSYVSAGWAKLALQFCNRSMGRWRSSRCWTDGSRATIVEDSARARRHTSRSNKFGITFYRELNYSFAQASAQH